MQCDSGRPELDQNWKWFDEWRKDVLFGSSRDKHTILNNDFANAVPVNGNFLLRRRIVISLSKGTWLRFWCIMLCCALYHPFGSGVRAATRLAGEELIGELRAVTLDSLGACWIGSPKGLLLFDGQWLRDMGSWEGYDGGGVQAMAVDRENRLWVASDSGMYRRDKRFSRVESGLQRPGTKVHQLGFSNGHLLRATASGLFLDIGDNERALLTGVDVLSLWVSDEGEIFAGCALEGLYRFDARGNPAVMPRSYRSQMPTIRQLGSDSQYLWMLGQDSRGRESLLQLELASEQFRSFELDPLRGQDSPGDSRLARVGHEMLLLDQGHWRHLDAAGPGSVLALGSTGLNWPIENPAWWLPSVFMHDLPGDYIKISTQRGILAVGDERATLVWASDQARPLQVLTRGQEGRRDRLLLLEQAGIRELYGSWQGGPFRRLTLPAGAGKPLTLCWSPDGQAGDVLVGTSDHILRLSPTGEVLGEVAGNQGANWMQPITGDLVLLAGEQGLALLDGQQARPLAIREPVLRASHDGLRDVVALCADYLLQLNALNEVDTLALPPDFMPPVRQLLALPGGKIWLLDGERLHLHPGTGSGWTRPLLGRPVLERQLLSLSRDGRNRLWISGQDGYGYLNPDALPPLIQLAQDPSRLDLSSDLELDFLCSDPLRPGTELKLRHRLNGGGWSGWATDRKLFVAARDEGLRKGANLLQVQARDEWGNLSEMLELNLFLPENAGRIRLARKAAMLVSLLTLVVGLTLIWPGRTSLVLTLLMALAVSTWIYFRTEEPYLWIVLPLLLTLIRQSTRLYLLPGQKDPPAEAARGILELVDLFREFGHSGVATRNLDRLLRCCRNLYDDHGVDEEVRRRLLEAREVYRSSTRQTLESLLDGFDWLPARENPVAPAQLSQVRERVQRLSALVDELEDPPSRSELEELELTLAALEKQLGRLERAVDRQVAANPVKVLDGLLIQLRDELGGVALTLSIPQELRGMLIRLPVPRLQFILENLISNALYWMKDREQPRLSIELRERPTLLQILVRDNGPGVPEDQWERIFDPGTSGRPSSESGGYGLYRSREILARFGGRLLVNDSEPGQGTCFLLEAKKVEPEA